MLRSFNFFSCLRHETRGVSDNSCCSDNLQPLCRCLALVGYLFVLNSLPLMECAEAGLFNGRDVNENVSATAIRRLNKSICLGRVEPLHCALGHTKLRC